MKVLVIGANGKIGGLVSTLLVRAGFGVLAADVHDFATNADANSEYFKIPALNKDSVSTATEDLIKKADMIMPILPAQVIPPVARAAHKYGKHYIDPTEVVETTEMIRNLPKNGSYMIPQCGLAPGFIGIVGGQLSRKYINGSIRNLKLMVGALPQNPVGPLKWASTWSAIGMITECLEPCNVIIDGKKRKVPALEGREDVMLEGELLRAAYTSGGLGTITETFPVSGEACYKTLRYPKHWRRLTKLLKYVRTPDDIPLLSDRIVDRHPPTDDDRVVVVAEVSGINNDEPLKARYSADFRPTIIQNKTRTAIAWTTAAGIVAVAELARDGKLNRDENSNFVRQENIPLSAFLATKSGSLYAMQSNKLNEL